jgi:molecular chaperone HscB
MVADQAPAQPMPDHFETLGLPRRFAVDLSDLERRYRELSRELHPDKFATAAPAERRVALERSTTLNDAYRVLKEPLRRAAYFLELNGLKIDGEGPEGRSPIQLSPEFLGQFLELRESFAEGSSTSDSREEMRDRIQGERTDRADALLKDLAELPASVAREQLLPYGERLLELRYYDRFLAELEEDEETDR